MKNLILTLLLLLTFSCSNGQQKVLDKGKIKADLKNILADLSQNYIYLHDKNVDLDCIKEHYQNEIENLDTQKDVVLFFEYLLYEFYDSHLILNTNTKSSFRLFAPIFTTFQNGEFVVTNVWQTQIENFGQEIIGAKIKKINGTDINDTIETFPTFCNDKESPKVREWIANKIIAGRYNEPRVLTLELQDKKTVDFDLDKILLKKTEELLTPKRIDNIGVIRINNSLGNNDLVTDFDKSLDGLMDTKALIIDLRNTVDGGNSYVARGIMSRFIQEPKPYQKHWTKEKYGDNPNVERSWTEYVNPRSVQYEKPVFILVGRWTGSMGEGLAIGFDGMQRGQIIGTEMERLAGEMSGFSFDHLRFGYRLSTAKLFHVNGIPREKYVPSHYVKQTTTKKDETLEKALELIKQQTD